MTGSHEVVGSIPISSTTKIKGLRHIDDNPFFLKTLFWVHPGTTQTF
ncbi:MAG: hypothetical protein QG552_2400 [Thermodesulfobacteriota bacterium]|nr:hypothetical protein [Thermodesulfobacteriota bacterium]